MATVVPAEGLILERVLDATHPILPQDLSREAYARFDAAQKKTAWGRHHLRRYALVDGGDVLASAAQCDLAAVLDKRPVRVCGIGGMFTQPARAGGHARELLDRLLDQAVRDGAERKNRDKLDAIVTLLLVHESLDEPEIYAAAGITRSAVVPSPAPVPT